MVLPGVGRSMETTRPEKAHDRPEVDGGGCEPDRNYAQAHGNQARVDGVIALTYGGEVQATGMSHVERDECHKATDCRRGDAVPQHADPCINLCDFFPPV